MKTVFFIADFDVRLNQQIATGLLKELQQHGRWHLHMHDWKGASLAPQKLQHALQETRPQALVTHSPTFRSKCPGVLRALSMPWVVVGIDWLPQDPVPAVVPGNKGVGTMAADYLLAQRFEHFAMLGFRETVSLARFEAFRDRITRARKTLDEFVLPHRYGRGHWSRTASVGGGDAQLVRWLRRLRKPCALFAYSDNPAAHVVRICAEHGIRVPDEVAVLGVDNDELFCHSVVPNLASVHVDNARMGKEAARLIVNWHPGRRLLELPPQSVIERESVRALQTEDPLVNKALEYLRAHVADGVRVRDLQKLTGLTPQMLVYRFREAIRSTPMEEILRHRVARASQLLTETDEPIGMIGSQCGFNGATQFFVTFRNQTGMSPREYRAQFAL